MVISYFKEKLFNHCYLHLKACLNYVNALKLFRFLISLKGLSYFKYYLQHKRYQLFNIDVSGSYKSLSSLINVLYKYIADYFIFLINDYKKKLLKNMYRIFNVLS